MVSENASLTVKQLHKFSCRPPQALEMHGWSLAFSLLQHKPLPSNTLYYSSSKMLCSSPSDICRSGLQPKAAQQRLTGPRCQHLAIYSQRRRAVQLPTCFCSPGQPRPAPVAAGSPGCRSSGPSASLYVAGY